MILNFLNKTKNSTSENKSDDLTKIIALMIHAARIDENYTNKEEDNSNELFFVLSNKAIFFFYDFSRFHFFISNN